MQSKNSQSTAENPPHRQSPHLVDLRIVAQQKKTVKTRDKARNFLYELFEERPKRIKLAKNKMPKQAVKAAIKTEPSKPIERAAFTPVQPVEKTAKIKLKRVKLGFGKQSAALWSSVKRTSLGFLSILALPAVYAWLGVATLLFGAKALLVRSAGFIMAMAVSAGKSISRAGRRKGALKQFGTIERQIETDWTKSFSNYNTEVNSYFKAASEDLETPRAFSLRPVIGFAVVLFVIILPFKGYSYFESLDSLRVKVLTSSEAAITELFRAGHSATAMNFQGASTNFSEASRQFASAQENLSEINSLLFVIAKLLPNNDVRLAGNSKSIIEAGRIGADLGSKLTMAIDGLVNDRHKGLDVAVANFIKNGEQAIDLSERLDIVLGTIDQTALPGAVRPKFAELEAKSDIFKGSLGEVVEIAKKLAILFGTERDTRYLLVFQNNSEMRASGGFFGSYALIDFSRGKIKKLEVPAGGTYDVEAGYKERIIAPTPLQMVNPLWHLWDANWWYDWPTTARKLEWFYAKSGGPTVDGVISFTPTVIEDFLRAYGPVDLTKDYGVVITADNFWQVAQTFSEQKPDVTKKPKRIIGDLFQAIIDDFPNRLNRPALLQMVASAQKSLNEKQALFYFNNQELADFVSQYGWDGRVKETTQDYLAVIHSSVAGGKSDREISQTISHRATVLADGSVIDEVEIVRRHMAARGALFTGQRNVDWLRVYVPAGSELIEAAGFNPPDQKYFEKPDSTWTFDADLAPEDRDYQLDEQSGTKIYQELGKTVFANWSMIDPGETRRLYIKYRLPFRVVKELKPDFPEQVIDLFGLKGENVLSYGLLVQKQPGSLHTRLSSSLNVDPYQRAHSAKLAWRYSTAEAFKVTKVGWYSENELLQDQYQAMLFQDN